MVWTIPLVDVAGVLAVTFTSGSSALLVSPPLQRPGQPGDELAVGDPTVPEPTPPELPLAPPTELPSPTPPIEAAPTPTPTVPPAAAEPIEPPNPTRERLLRPTDRRRFFTMSAGGATPTSPYALYYGSSMDFQMEAAIGARARRFPNFGGSFVVQYRRGVTTELSLAGRLQWDRPLSKQFAIYSSMDFTVGINETIGVGGYLYPGIPSALLGIGWSAKMILAERMMLFLRPIGPNLVAPSPGSQLYMRFRWDVGAGIGVVW